MARNQPALKATTLPCTKPPNGLELRSPMFFVGSRSAAQAWHLYSRTSWQASHQYVFARHPSGFPGPPQDTGTVCGLGGQQVVGGRSLPTFHSA